MCHQSPEPGRSAAIILALGVALCSFACVRIASESERPPNVLLITIDTLRADHLGCYGYNQIRTPVLDALAHEGVRFDRAFSPVPLTLPAHCSILTGTYPSFHGVRDNSGYVLQPSQTTIAEILKNAGYRTAGFVGAFVLDSKFGLNQGFDFYYDDFDLSKYENVSPGYIQHTGDEVVGQAIRWLEGQKGGGAAPFFLWVHLYDPHDPYTPPEPYLSSYPRSPYDGEIAFTDHNVGTLFEWLRANGMYDNTLIAVLGDHGESLGEHGESKHGYFAYNATLHVPWILKFPHAQYAGRVVEQSVSSVDLLPTLLQALNAGAGRPASVQGRELLSLVQGKDPNYRAEIYAECYYPRLQFGWSEIRVLITPRYEYLMVPRPELYDYTRDFAQTHNIIADNRALANGLHSTLRSLIRRHEAAPAAAVKPSTIDPAARERLRSLGYISEGMGNRKSDDYQNLPDPKDEIGTYNEILGLFERETKGEYRALIPRYEQILKSQPALKIAHYKLAQAYYHTGNYEAAVKEYRRAIDLGGDTALATFDLALTYMKLGRTADAIDGLRRTIDIDPAHYRARTNLGVLLRSEGKYEEAIQQFQAALAEAPRSVFALSNLAISYSMIGRHQDAEATMRKALELAPKDGLLHANLAAVLARMGKPEEAQQEMELARKLNPRLRD
jgi:arylsulfatase A-like enzyme/Flp pilus assembly protein TadD